MRSGFKIEIFFIVATLLFVLPGLAGASQADNDPKVKAAFDRGWYLFGQMHKDIKNLDLAIAQYREVLALYPDNADAMWKMSETVFKKGQILKDWKKGKPFFDQSLSWAEKAAAIAPQKPEPHYWIAVNMAVMAEINRTVKALGMIKRCKRELALVISLAPKNRFATLSKVVLASIYNDSPWPVRDLEKALCNAREAVAEDPNMTYASTMLGKVYASLGKTDLAKKELSRCLSIARPTYVWDSIIYDWPDAKKVLASLK
ncbi:MAG: hypothetical protein HZB23_12400 [Deltaproteobacteria bacterium]|nr:hypothetical protein [Deltaproteobacteria bacterium]